jgi:Domain of unknown function (DUF4349)
VSRNLIRSARRRAASAASARYLTAAGRAEPAAQQQISTQESSLEALQAQQRALAGETSYGTVSVTLVSPHPVPAKKKARKTTRQHGFVAGFAAGWHGLRLIVSGILTALGAALPFAVPGAMLVAAGYAGRRPLRRLLRWPRRGTRPTAAG